MPFSRELYIEQDDFREDPPGKFFRLAPGREVRLRAAYIIKCVGVVKDAERRSRRTALHLRSGITQRHARRQPQGERHDPLGLGRRSRSARKCGCSITCSRSWIRKMSRRARIGTRTSIPIRWKCSSECYLEPSLAAAKPGDHFQFERLGYFTADSVDSRPGQPVFNRSVPLRDTWAKIEKSQS